MRDPRRPLFSRGHLLVLFAACARYMGLRDDRKPRDVFREASAGLKSESRPSRTNAEQTISLFTALPYSDVALALMALSALGCLLLMRGRAPGRPVERWIWREIRALETDPLVRRW